MPSCPNCGHETERTEDWACRWCGYPLLSNGYSAVDIKDTRDTHYIRLTSAGREHLDSIRCVFDEKYASALGQLTIGETITIQGQYDGSIITIRMKDCSIVKVGIPHT